LCGYASYVTTSLYLIPTSLYLIPTSLYLVPTSLYLIPTSLYLIPTLLYINTANLPPTRLIPAVAPAAEIENKAGTNGAPLAGTGSAPAGAAAGGGGAAIFTSRAEEEEEGTGPGYTANGK
jgi:hypothetical protein